MRDDEEDLGVEQEEVPVEEADLGDEGAGINHPELEEDLRRARTNPPQTTRRAPDPYSDIDRGYLEDEEGRDLTEELDESVELEPEDPVEAEVEGRDRAGRST